MKFFSFLTAFLSVEGFQQAVDTTITAGGSVVDNIPNTIVNLIIGIVSAVVINILKAKYPKLFKKSK